MKKFDLVGVNGNAWCVMGYTSNALKQVGLGDKVDDMTKEAMSGDYNNLLNVCFKYVEMANKKLAEDGLLEDYNEED